jgi:hypothetical protein
MSYRNAFAVVVVIGGAVFADMYLNEGKALLFLLRKLVDLTIWMSFWR